MLGGEPEVDVIVEELGADRHATGLLLVEGADHDARVVGERERAEVVRLFGAADKLARVLALERAALDLGLVVVALAVRRDVGLDQGRVGAGAIRLLALATERILDFLEVGEVARAERVLDRGDPEPLGDLGVVLTSATALGRDHDDAVGPPWSRTARRPRRPSRLRCSRCRSG